MQHRVGLKIYGCSTVVLYVCLAYEDACPAQAPSYFTQAAYKAAAMHVTKSPRCKMSQKKIATVVLPNRPVDNEAVDWAEHEAAVRISQPMSERVLHIESRSPLSPSILVNTS